MRFLPRPVLIGSIMLCAGVLFVHAAPPANPPADAPDSRGTSLVLVGDPVSWPPRSGGRRRIPAWSSPVDGCATGPE